MFRIILKSTFGIIVIALAIYGGIYAWFEIKAMEDIHQTNIYEAIPADPGMMMVVHRPAQLAEVWNICNKFTHFLPEEKSPVIIDAIGKSQICSEQCIDKSPLAICYYPEGTLLFSKMKKKDFEYLEKKFFKNRLSGFAPKKEVYKDAEINIKATNNERFFSYALYHNIFIGSFEKRLVHQAIDTYIQQTGLMNDANFDKNALAGLRLNNPEKSLIFKELVSDTLNNHRLTGDIKIKDSSVEISGFFPVNEIAKDTVFVQVVGNDSIRLFVSPNQIENFYSLSMIKKP